MEGRKLISTIIVMTMIIAIVLTTSACNKTKKALEPVSIQLSFAGNLTAVNLDYEKVYLDAAENFHKLYPNITITINYSHEPTLIRTDITKLLATEDSPDIIQLDLNYLEIADKKDLLLDLKHLTSSKEMDINERILDASLINGKMLILPIFAVPKVMVYRKEFFEDVNISYPQGAWTWEQFRDISKKLKPMGSVLPYDIATLNLLMGSTGKGVLSPDGTTSVAYLDSPEAIRTLSWLNKYYQDDKLKQTPMDFNDALNQFGNSPTGMSMDIWPYLLKLTSEDTIGIASLPYFEGGKRANPVWLSGFGISKNSKHAEEAWQFIKYLTLTKQETANKLTDFYLTTSKAMADASGQSSDPAKSVYIEEANYVVKPAMDNNLYFYNAWNEERVAQFEGLFGEVEQDLPIKLHELALKLDEELNRLKNADKEATK
ncbi:extracellular solute-binding protein [Paenibacillus psychroresistens]|uniref:Extracellular solute-binding protein n=1 Tax=Paenibacillus psychroresistens TaxID=1778678 RepID=A0A6B8RUG7_9BACL|nr:extracellular solute-binding protein [Paenibacillus psychroresistens]QGQ99449.1 extracellular solute-binding protein [Paenibacillus psychroresistens]